MTTFLTIDLVHERGSVQVVTHDDGVTRVVQTLGTLETLTSYPRARDIDPLAETAGWPRSGGVGTDRGCVGRAGRPPGLIAPPRWQRPDQFPAVGAVSLRDAQGPKTPEVWYQSSSPVSASRRTTAQPSRCRGAWSRCTLRRWSVAPRTVHIEMILLAR